MLDLQQIRTDLENFKNHAEVFIGTHVPALVEFAEKAQASPITQALEGTFLPPDVEAELANVIKVVASKFPPPAAPEPEPEPDGAEQ